MATILAALRKAIRGAGANDDVVLKKKTILSMINDIQTLENTNSTVETVTAAGALSLSTTTSLLVTSGAIAITLAAGSEGQRKFIRMKTDGGDATLTPSALQGGTTLTFNDAGDYVELFYTDSKWHIIENSGATLA